MRQFPTSKRAITAAFCLMCLLSVLTSANGTVITDPNQLGPGAALIDFEGFNTGGNLVTDVPDPLTIGNVTFTSVTGNLSVFDISVSGWAANGTEVESKTLFPGGEPDSAIVIQFANPVSQFLLGWGDPNFAGNVLLAFDANGTLLKQGAVALGPIGGVHAAWIGFARPTADISTIVVQPDQSFPSGDDYVIDNIYFNEGQPFAQISPRLQLKMDSGPNDDKFQIHASFVLGPGSNGISPLIENITLSVGKISMTIPAGAFTQNGAGVFKFDGMIDAAELSVTLRATRQGYEFDCKGSGIDFDESELPMFVGLLIGDDFGSTVMTNSKLTAESE